MIDYKVEDNGIAIITWAMQNSPMNVLNKDSLEAYEAAVDRAIADEAVKGVIVTSARPEFIAGADLRMLARAKQQSAEEMYNWTRDLQNLFRKQETSGKPFVAAINGTALGGGLELTLATHYRVAADNPKAKLGLPEVKLGLLPGGGGTQRLSRLIGAREALPLLTQGRDLSPKKALEKGVVHAVVPADELLDAARAYILEGGAATQPWDDRKFRIPGGACRPRRDTRPSSAARGCSSARPSASILRPRRSWRASTTACRCRSIAASRTKRVSSRSSLAGTSPRT